MEEWQSARRAIASVGYIFPSHYPAQPSSMFQERTKLEEIKYQLAAQIGHQPSTSPAAASTLGASSDPAAASEMEQVSCCATLGSSALPGRRQTEWLPI